MKIVLSPLLFILALVGTLSISSTARAYPDFIGHGYASCLTCHYNGQGSGPLNDYGRALWSAEIASRALYPKSMSDEDIAAQSGFLGTVELPSWFRPYIKFRDLNLKRNFRSSQEASFYYRMQQEVGAAFSDGDGKYVGVFTMGNLQYGGERGDVNRFLPKEYFVRIEFAKTWWLYAGLMERVFGIRNIDHSSFQRSPQGFNPTLDSRTGNWFSQGVILQRITDTWELNFNSFIGNPNMAPELRHKGNSIMGDYEIGTNKRLGASVMTAKSEVDQRNLAAVHYRQGFDGGASLLAEYGYIEEEQPGTEMKKGTYNFLQTLVPIVRGYNLKLTAERYNSDFRPSVPDQWKWMFGLLAWPAPRLELRVEAVNYRQFTEQQAADDAWALQGQIHVSL